MPHEETVADQGSPPHDVAAGGEPLAAADHLQDENAQDVFLDAAAVEVDDDDAQDELNAAAEMLVDEIVPSEDGHGHGVDYSVQGPVGDVQDVTRGAHGATDLNAAYEPLQLQTYDTDVHSEYADVAVEPAPVGDTHANESVAGLTAEPPTKRVKLENEDVLDDPLQLQTYNTDVHQEYAGIAVDPSPVVGDTHVNESVAELSAESPAKRVKLENEVMPDGHEESLPTAPAFSEYNVAEQHAAVALANTHFSTAHRDNSMNSQTVQARGQDPNRKKRKEFTASEKLQILAELDLPNPPSIKELMSKYGLSKSSFHRWRQEGFRERLVAMASGEKVEAAESLVDVATIVNAETSSSLLYKGHKKRDMNDGLMPLKRAIQTFISYNASLPEEEQYAIRSGFLQIKARELRNELVASAMEREKEISEYKGHEYQMNYADPNKVAPQPLFSPHELKALKAFKGSKSWSCQIAGQLGLLQTEWSEAAKQNTQRYMDAAELASAGPLCGTVDIKKPKKSRVEFTALDKIRILKEVEESNAQRKAEGLPVWSVEEICERYGTSKSSLHRWRQQQRSGVLESVVDEGHREVKRIFRDKLTHIKQALIEYAQQERHGEGVGYEMLQERALAVRDELLRGYEVLHGLPVGGVENTVATAAFAESDVQDGATTNASVGSAAVIETTTTATDVNDAATATNILEPSGDSQEQPSSNDAATNDRESNSDPAQPKEEPPAILYTPSVPITYDEYNHLSNFKASTSWLREVAKKYKFNMDVSDETKLQWKEWEEGRGDAALHENYYEHVIPSQHSELPPLDVRAEDQAGEQQQDGVIGEEQVEEILNGHGNISYGA
jgi:transposase-like protein